MKKDLKIGIILVSIIIIGIISLYLFYTEIDLKKNTNNQLVVQDKSLLKKAPKLMGMTGLINTSEKDLEKIIQDNVVLYDFWTYSCINCIRTLPHITAWDEKYNEDGLVIIGIHTPEFEFEKNKDNVMAAVKKFGINYPVVLDNNKEIWKSFENRYWPRKYITDNEGYIRFDHIGEGAYKETELVIQELLQENKNQINTSQVVEIEEYKHSILRTPELYFGYEFASGRNQLGNIEGFQPNKIIDYRLPENIRQHYFYLDGQWENGKDGMKLISSSGKIVLNFHAKQLNIGAVVKRNNRGLRTSRSIWSSGSSGSSASTASTGSTRSTGSTGSTGSTVSTKFSGPVAPMDPVDPLGPLGLLGPLGSVGPVGPVGRLN